MPTLERSRKKQLYDTLGSNWDHVWMINNWDLVENYRKASEFPERYMGENRSLEEILNEEENWE